MKYWRRRYLWKLAALNRFARQMRGLKLPRTIRFGDYPFEPSSAADQFSFSGEGMAAPLTLETFRAAHKAMKEWRPTPHVELHSPRCPKILTKARLACRCGANPTEGIFEDELERMGQ